MSEIGEIYGAMKEVQREERAVALQTNTRRAMELGLAVSSHNNGQHLVIASRFDFWPSTEKYRDRKTGKYDRGADKLFELVRAWP